MVRRAAEAEPRNRPARGAAGHVAAAPPLDGWDGRPDGLPRRPGCRRRLPPPAAAATVPPPPLGENVNRKEGHRNGEARGQRDESNWRAHRVTLHRQAGWASAMRVPHGDGCRNSVEMRDAAAHSCPPAAQEGGRLRRKVGTIPDEPEEILRGGVGRGRPGVGVEGVLQLGRLDRLGQVGVHAGHQALLAIALHGVGGQRDHRDARQPLDDSRGCGSRRSPAARPSPASACPSARRRSARLRARRPPRGRCWPRPRCVRASPACAARRAG